MHQTAISSECCSLSLTGQVPHYTHALLNDCLKGNRSSRNGWPPGGVRKKAWELLNRHYSSKKNNINTKTT